MCLDLPNRSIDGLDLLHNLIRYKGVDVRHAADALIGHQELGLDGQGPVARMPLAYTSLISWVLK